MKKRIVALLLCVVMLLTELPLAVFAEELSAQDSAAQPETAPDLTDDVVSESENPAGAAAVPDGQTAEPSQDEAAEQRLVYDQGNIKISTDAGDMDYQEAWDRNFPYGTFAFAETDGTIYENGVGGSETLLIPLYRLGGLTGRATAYVTLAMPAAEDDDLTDAFAMSFLDDATLEVEKTNPIAYYEPLSAPKMEPSPEPVHLELREFAGTEEYPDAEYPMTIFPVLEDGALLEAENYAWQYLPRNSTWRTMPNTDAQTLDIDYDTFMGDDGIPLQDYRVVYYKDGKTYCTPTLILDTPYDPAEDAGSDILPDSLGDYEPMTFTEYVPDEPYEMVEFAVTFADGEFAKYFRVTAKNDDTYSFQRMAMLTVTECTGGVCCDLCGTYLITKVDDDLGDRRPSQFSLDTDSVSVSYQEDCANITVRRTGDTRFPATVKVITEAGTAVPGNNYIHTEKELAYVAGMEEATVSVPLLATGFTGKKTFTVRLTEVSTPELVSLGDIMQATVEITGKRAVLSAKASASPVGVSALHSGSMAFQRLMQSENIDVVENVSVGDSLLAAESADAVGGEKKEETTADLYGRIETSTHGGPYSSYTYEENIKFSRDDFGGDGGYDDSNYWKDDEISSGGSDEAYDIMKYRDLFTKPGFEGNSMSIDEKYNPKWKSRFVRNADGTVDDYSFTHEIVMGHNDTTTTPSQFEIDNANLLFSYMELEADVVAAAIARYDNYDDEWLEESHYRFTMPWVEVKAPVSESEYEDFDEDDDNRGRTDSDKRWLYDFHPRKFNDNDSYPLGSSYVRKTFVFDPANTNRNLRIRMGLSLNWNGSNRILTNGKDDHTDLFTNANTVLALSKLSFRRRVLQNTSSIGLTIHTANDENVKDVDGLKIISKELYPSIRPVVSLVPGKSGIDSAGNLYIGSQLRVEMSDSGSFMPYSGENPSETVFVTNKKGEKIPCEITRGETNDVYLITLLWDGMNVYDTSEKYTVNVVLERRQEVQIDIRPSLDRLPDATIDYSPESLQKGWDRLFKGGEGITVTYGQRLEQSFIDSAGVPHYFTNTATKTITKNDIDTSSGVMRFRTGALSGVINIQSICFHLDREDSILFNGMEYAGDETIWLDSSGFSLSLMNFLFYDKSFREMESLMETTIIKQQLYYDTNANGRIDGEYNAYTGYFVLDESSGDSYVTDIDDMTCVDTMLAPESAGLGNVSQYFIKTYYTMTPRALAAKDGVDPDNTFAQVLPMFVSSLTNAVQQSKLTPEQQSYRCILASPTTVHTYNPKNPMERPVKENPISSDNHVMYGALATQQTYMDIPLGGDTSAYHSLFPDSVEEFTGNLRIPFASPTALKWTDYNGVEHTTEDADSANGYLGAFINDTTYALYTQEQTELTNVDCIKPECITMGTVTAMQNGDTMGTSDEFSALDADISSKQGEGGVGQGFDFSTQFQFPAVNISASPFEINMFNNQIWASINFPLKNKTKEYNTK